MHYNSITPPPGLQYNNILAILPALIRIVHLVPTVTVTIFLVIQIHRPIGRGSNCIPLISLRGVAALTRTTSTVVSLSSPTKQQQKFRKVGLYPKPNQYSRYRHLSVMSPTTTTVSSSSSHDDSNSSNHQKYRTTLINEKVQHIPKDNLPEWMMKERTRILYESTAKSSGTPSTTSTDTIVVYWMQRDVRTADNWALLLAAHYAAINKTPMHVLYAIPPPPPPTTTTIVTDDAIPDLVHLPMTERHGQFLLGGLECVYNELQEYNVPLHVVMATTSTTLVADDDTVGSAAANCILNLSTSNSNSSSSTNKNVVVVTDFSALRHHREWKEIQFINAISSSKWKKKTNSLSVYQVDTHNVVPVWMASTYREYGARTIRPKINKQYHNYLQKFPKWYEVLHQHQPEQKPPTSTVSLPPFQRLVYETYMRMDALVPVLGWAKPGTKAALERVEKFFQTGLPKFDTHRNDPNYGTTICSNLSPWINHGHVSFQRITMAVKKFNKYANGTASYLEEGIIRRELSDNYCYYDPYKYDTLQAAADWAQETLRVHASDQREYVYTVHELETGCTHDDLWNAAQLQAVRDGKMHGFLRMYWAKKILEWTTSPSLALQIGFYLNDKYNIDGRDPNGFVGVGWSIMGIHDMGWKEREVFGKIRYMNYAGCKRKFKVDEFVAKYPGAAENARQAMKKHHGIDSVLGNESTATTASRKKPSSTTDAGSSSSTKKKAKTSTK